MLVIGALLTGTSLFGLQESFYWKKQGVATQAQVLNKFIKEECSTNSCLDNYYIVYQYAPAHDQIYKGEDSVNHTLWRKHDTGHQISILYASDAPEKSSVNYAYGLDTSTTLWWLILVIGLILFVSGLALVIRKK